MIVDFSFGPFGPFITPRDIANAIAIADAVPPDPQIGQTVKVELTLAITQIGQHSIQVEHPRGVSARHFMPGDRFVQVTPIAVNVIE